MAQRIATIGVYGFDAESFIEMLRRSRVALLVDVRQRRGVRGAQYAWANSRRLQSMLGQAAIEYDHRPGLAPTTELRQLQYRHDDEHGVGKRTREELAPAYRDRYRAEILARADLESLIDALPADQDGIGALLCVETLASACHRSLIAERLEREHGLRTVHLLPPELAD